MFYSENGATAIATDQTHIYWTEPDRHRVRRIPKSGGPPIDLAVNQRAPWDVALVGRDVIFSNNIGGVPQSSIASVPKQGGQVKTLISGIDGITRMRADDSGVYYMAAGTIERVPLAGGARDIIVSGFVDAVAVDAANVYWLAREKPLSGPAFLQKMSKQSGSITRLATYDKGASDIVVTEDRLFSTVRDSVYAVPKSGGTPVRIARSLGTPADLVAYHGVLYFSAGSIQGKHATNGLLRAPAAGAQATVMFWGDFGVGPLAVDADGIWWSTYGDAVGLVRTPL